MSRKIWVSLAVLLLLAGGGVVAAKLLLRHRALQWKQQGLAAADAGDFARAADLLGRFVTRYGADSATLRRYVQVREVSELPNGRHLTDALGALRVLTRHKDSTLEDRRHLLDLYVRLERAPEALDTAGGILAEAKNDSRALKVKVEMLTRLRREREALGVAQDWSRALPNDIDAQMAYFELRAAVEQSPEAVLKDAKALAAQHPEDPRFEMLLGSVYARTGDVAGAREWLNKAAGRPSVDEPTVKSILAQLDGLGLAQDSIAVLRARAKAGADAELRHMLGQRDWEVGAWAEAADLLADVNPKDLRSDATLAAQRAIALTNLGKRADAEAVRAALAGRKQAASDAWSLLMRRILDSETVADKAVVAACQSALFLEPRNSYLNYYLGDADARLGEADLAVDAWQRSVAVNPTWPMPSVRLVELLLQKGRGRDALEIAQRAQRTGNSAAVILLAKAAAAYFEHGGAGDKNQLFTLIDVVQKELPGEDQTLLVRADLLAQQGKKDEATAVARSIVARRPAPPEQVLLAVASLSRKYHLGLESETLAASEQAHGATPHVAFVRALDQFVAGRGDAGLKGYDEAATRSGKADEPVWRLYRAHYLDVTGSPAAHDAWVALADAFPDSVLVQQAAVTARAVSHDWQFMPRTIERLKALTDQKGLAWQMAQARLYVEAARSDADLEQGSVLLTGQIIPQNPGLAEAHVLLAEALVRLKRIDGAIEHLEYATQIEPDNVAVALRLAGLLQSRGNFERVRQELDHINDQLQNSDQRHQAAALLARQGQLDKAISVLENQPDAPPDLLLADLYRRRRQLDKAEAIAKKLMEQPTLEAVKFTAALYLSQGRRADAEAALAKLDTLDLSPGVKESTLGRYALQIGNLDEATRRFQEATRQAPTNAEPWRLLAASQLVAGKSAEAMTTLDEAARIIPADAAFAAIKRQSALFTAAAADPGLRAIALSIVADPSAPDVAFELLRVITDGRRSLENEHLAGQLQQFAERHPDSLPAQLQLAAVYGDMGRKVEALTVVQRAMGTFASDAEPARVAVRAAAAAQRWQDMVAAAEAWKKRAPDETPAADLAVARARIGAGQFNEVLSQLQPYISAIKADPQKNPHLTEAYAIGLINTGGADDASALLWAWAQKSADWRLRWAQVAVSAVDHDLSAQWLDRLATIVPADSIGEQITLASAYDQLASVTKDSQTGEKSTQIYARIAGDPKAGGMALLAAGYRAENHGDAKSAEALYRRAIAADDSLFVAKNNLAMILANNNGDLAEAQRLAAEVVAGHPRIAGAHDTLAYVRAKTRNYQAAADAEKAAVEIDPDNLIWRVHEASYLLNAGDQVRAAAALKALDAARLDTRKASPEIQKELNSLRARIRGERAQALP